MAEIDTDAERERIEQWRRDEAFFSTCEAARLYLSKIDRLRAENQRLKLAALTADRESLELEAENRRLRAALDHLLAIAVESEGVAGWHRNGDVYQWDDIISTRPELNAELNRYQEAQEAGE